MLPRRKCAASVQSYKEDDVETDDSFICEYRVLTCHLFMLIFVNCIQLCHSLCPEIT